MQQSQELDGGVVVSGEPILKACRKIGPMCFSLRNYTFYCSIQVTTTSSAEINRTKNLNLVTVFTDQIAYNTLMIFNVHPMHAYGTSSHTVVATAR